jgi:hypothetical protein
MDRTQTAEINKHMLKAANAINRASQIISALDGEDRATLAAPLEKIVLALHFEVLRAVYVRIRTCGRLQPVDPLTIRSAGGKKLFFRNPSPRLISIRSSFRP